MALLNGEEDSTNHSPRERLNKMPKTLGAHLKRYCETEVSTDHADILLLMCCVISGLVDSTVYNGISHFKLLKLIRMLG